MKKIMFVGRSECGKTTLTQALRGDTIAYHKTQYVNHHSVVIDTPGEYAQVANLGRALALYSYEADVIGLLLSTIEPYSLYPPCVAACVNRPVIGIVTQIDQEKGNIQRAHDWLKMTGADPIFHVSSYTGEGISRRARTARTPPSPASPGPADFPPPAPWGGTAPRPPWGWRR